MTKKQLMKALRPIEWKFNQHTQEYTTIEFGFKFEVRPKNGKWGVYIDLEDEVRTPREWLVDTLEEALKYCWKCYADIACEPFDVK